MLSSLYQMIMSEFAKNQNYPKFTFEVVMNNFSGRTDAILRVKFVTKADADLFATILGNHQIYSIASHNSLKPVNDKIPGFFCIHLEQKEVKRYCKATHLTKFDLVIGDVYPSVSNANQSNQSNNNKDNNQASSSTTSSTTSKGISVGFNNFLNSNQIIDKNANLAAVDIFKLNISQHEQYIQGLITNNQAIVKVIGMSNGYLKNISFILKQINDPTQYRPSRALHRGYIDGQSVSKINCLTGDENPNYVIGSGRKTKLKNNRSFSYTHTNKTAVTCWSSVPYSMSLFDVSGGEDVIFLFNRMSCDNKQHKYSWKTNVVSNSLFHLNCTKFDWHNVLKSDSDKQSVTIDEIIKQNERSVRLYKPGKNNLTTWNELLYGLPKGRLDAIGVQYHDKKNVNLESYQLVRRLLSLNVMYFAKDKLKYTNYEPAMFVLMPDVAFKFYHHPDRLKDIIAAFNKTDQNAIKLLQNSNYALFNNIIKSALEAKVQIDSLIITELQQIIISNNIQNTVILNSSDSFLTDKTERKRIFLDRYQHGDLTHVFDYVKINKCENLLVKLLDEELSQVNNVNLNDKKLNLQILRFLLNNHFYAELFKLSENKNIPLDKLFVTENDKVDLIASIFNNQTATNEELTKLYKLFIDEFEMPDEAKCNEILSILESKTYNKHAITKLCEIFIANWKELPIQKCLEINQKTTKLLSAFLEHGVHKFTNAQLNIALKYYLSKNILNNFFNNIQIITSQPNFQIENIDEFIDLLVNCKDELVINAIFSIKNIQLILDNKNKIIKQAKLTNNELLCKKILYKSLHSKKITFDLTDSLLQLMLRDGDEELIKLFIDQDLYHLNSAGETPLSIALSLFVQDKKKYAEIVKLMLLSSKVEIQQIRKTDINNYAAAMNFKAHCENECNDNLLEHLFDKKELQLFKFFCRLEDYQFNSNSNDKNIDTFLERLLEINTFDYVGCIIENPGLLNLIDDQRKNHLFTVLINAHEFSLAFTVLKSIQFLSDKSIVSVKNNIVHTIIEFGDQNNEYHHSLIIDLLVKVKDKSYINQIDNNNETPMMVCIRTKHYSFAKTIFSQTYKLLSHDDFINYLHFAYQQEGACTDTIINIFKNLCECNIPLLSTTSKNNISLLDIAINHPQLANICLDTIVQQLNGKEIGCLLNNIMNKIKSLSDQNQLNVLYDQAYSLLDKCKSFDLIPNGEMNFLHSMVMIGNEKLVKMICEKAVSIDSPNTFGDSAFMLAAKANKFNLVAIFLCYPAKLNFQELNSVLIIAAKNKEYLLMKTILKLSELNFIFNNQAIDVNKNTALHYLMADKLSKHSNALEVFKLLVEKRAFLDVPNKKDKTPINVAMDNFNNTKMIWSRIVDNITVNNCNEKAAGQLLLYFCQIDLLDLAADLLEKLTVNKVDTTLTDVCNKTALSYALEVQHIKLTNLLSKNKAQVKQLTQSYTNNNSNLNSVSSIRNMADAGLRLGIADPDFNDLQCSLSEKKAFVISAIKQQLTSFTIEKILDWTDKLDNNNIVPELLFKPKNKFINLGLFGHQWKGKELTETGALVIKMAKNILLEKIAQDGLPADVLVQVKIQSFLNTKLGLSSTTKSSEIYSKLGTDKNESAKQELAIQIKKTTADIDKLAPLPKKM